MKVSRYYNAWFCVECDAELTSGQRMYSDGRCPECGFKHKSAGTIVQTYEKGFRYKTIKSKHWWQFNETVSVFDNINEVKQ